jgi:hypothetical protein
VNSTLIHNSVPNNWLGKIFNYVNFLNCVIFPSLTCVKPTALRYRQKCCSKRKSDQARYNHIITQVLFFAIHITQVLFFAIHITQVLFFAIHITQVLALNHFDLLFQKCYCEFNTNSQQRPQQLAW